MPIAFQGSSGDSMEHKETMTLRIGKQKFSKLQTKEKDIKMPPKMQEEYS